MKDTKLNISDKTVSVNLNVLSTAPTTTVLAYDTQSKSIGLVPLNGKEIAFQFELGVPNGTLAAAAHSHVAGLTAAQVQQLVEVADSTVTITSDTVVDGAAKHSHTLTIGYNRNLHTFTVLSVSPAGSLVHPVTLIAGGVSKDYVDTQDAATQNFVIAERDYLYQYVDTQDAALQTQIDTEKTRIDTLVTGAPQALDTLAEIAAQLNSDEIGTAAILATQQQHTQQITSLTNRHDIILTYSFGNLPAPGVFGVLYLIQTGPEAKQLYSWNGASYDLISTDVSGKADKSYVDTQDSNLQLQINTLANGSGNYVHLTGNENISGQKTFTDRVGIGTSTPESKFQVKDGPAEMRMSSGAAGETPYLAVINNNPGGKAAALIAGTGGSAFKFDESAPFYIASEGKGNFQNNSLGNSGAIQMTILPSGNIGIGTSTPTQKLDVNGNIASNGNIFTNAAVLPTFFSKGVIAARNSNGNSGDGSGVIVNVEESSFGGIVVGYTTSAPQKWLMGISNNVADRNAFVFYEDSAAAKARLTIATGGNVGVGTIAPSQKLEVVGNVKATGYKIGDYYNALTSNGDTLNIGDSNYLLQLNLAKNFQWRNDGTYKGMFLNAQGNLTTDGSVTATQFIGDGSQLTNLPVTQIANTDALAEGSTNKYFTQARVVSSPLTGLTATSGTPAATDTIVTAWGKVLNLFNTFSAQVRAVTLSGYNKASFTSSVNNADTVQVALGKLERRDDDKVDKSTTNQTFLGYNAGGTNNVSAGGDGITAIGSSAGLSNYANNNTFIGVGSGRSNTSGPNNVYTGAYAGQNNTTGQNNAYYGFFAGRLGNGGSHNVFFGSLAGQSTSGTGNVFLGSLAGQSNTTGNYNIALGYNSGPAGGTLDNTISVGANAQATTSNTMFITDTVKVGIGVQNPASKLTVNGDIESSVGIVMKSANGTRWRLTVSDAGSPVFTAI